MIYSQYLQAPVFINAELKETLLNIYEYVAKKCYFEPDYEDRKLVDFEKDPGLMDTIISLVEAFGEDHPDFASAWTHLLEDDRDEDTDGEDEGDLYDELFPDDVTTEKVKSAIEEFEGVVNRVIEAPSRDNYLSYYENLHSEGPVTYSLYYNGCQLGYGFDLDTLHAIVQCMTRKEQIDRNLEIEY